MKNLIAALVAGSFSISSFAAVPVNATAAPSGTPAISAAAAGIPAAKAKKAESVKKVSAASAAK